MLKVKHKKWLALYHNLGHFNKQIPVSLTTVPEVVYQYPFAM